MRSRFAVRPLAAAVGAALATLAGAHVAHAAEDDALRQQAVPTNSVEAGVGYVSDDSAYFGKYNGLFRKGPFGIFNFDWRGGSSFDGTGTDRWRIAGTDLGLDTRDIQFSGGQQGKFRIDAGYDELVRKYSDTYQTPFLGTGSNNLTLPSNWVVPRIPVVNNNGNFRGLDPSYIGASALVNGVLTAPTAAQTATQQAIIANDMPAFQDYGMEVKRQRYDVGFSYMFDPAWNVTASYRHLDRDGTKPMSTVALQSGTAAAIIPDPIDQSTDEFNAAINYATKQASFTAAYYGSVFRNHVDSLTWQNPFAPTVFNTMSSAPDNQFHQFTLTGGYNFDRNNKLVLFGSYGRGTQDQAFIIGPETPLGVPTNSLHGEIVTTAFNAKFTSKPVKDVNFLAAYKYEDRDNKTPVNTSYFYDAGEAPASGASPFNAALGLPANALRSNINIYATRPFSKKLNQFDVEGDWRFAPRQTATLAYQYQGIDRDCPGSWINCADAPKLHENTLRAEWHGQATEAVSARLSYAYSERRVDYNENGWLALVPMANVTPAVANATQSAYATMLQYGLGGFGPLAPYTALQPGNLGVFWPNNSAMPQNLYGSRNDIHELPGMRRFNMADRNRNKVRGMLDWQASDALDVSASLDYNDDDYSHSAFGLTSARGWAFNLDGAYQINDRFQATGFYSYEEQESKSAGWSYSAGSITNTATIGGVAGNTVVSGGCFATVAERNANAKIDPCLMWNTDMKDDVNTLGVGLRSPGWMGGRLNLSADLVYSVAHTRINVAGGTYANNPYAVSGQPPVNPAVFFIPATGLPTVKTEQFDVRLLGQYAIDKASAINMLYRYGHLSTNDFLYQGLQYNSLSSVMPTNEQSPNYNVQVIGVSYIYHWQ